MQDITITGAEQLSALARRLREASRNDLRKELLAGIRRAAKPMVAEVKASARETLPRRGGLADQVARSKVGVRTRLSASTAGVKIQAANEVSVAGLDAGHLRHPVFGRKKSWVPQSVTPGWFSRPIEKDAENVQHEIQAAMDVVAKKIEG